MIPKVANLAQRIWLLLLSQNQICLPFQTVHAEDKPSTNLTFSMQPNPKDPAPGVDGSITGYQISVTGMAPIDLPSSELSYEVNVTGDSSTEFTVSVAARNALGLGDTTTLGPYST